LFAEGHAELPELVVRALATAGATVAFAESCTGGLLASQLVDVAGASEVLRGAVVAYANEAKRDLLGVPQEVLASHGAVSEACVRAMAEGARTRFGATFAVATSGIAGPSGGTAEKPVGTVCFALAGPQGTSAWTAKFAPLGRKFVRDRAVVEVWRTLLAATR
jgi:nicotinamide-nucleotide amidase